MDDRVICVDTGGVPTLTLGKVYDARIYNYRGEDVHPYIGVFDDVGENRNFKRKRFMLLSEWRLSKLKEVGI